MKHCVNDKAMLYHLAACSEVGQEKAVTQIALEPRTNWPDLGEGPSRPSRAEPVGPDEPADVISNVLPNTLPFSGGILRYKQGFSSRRATDEQANRPT